MAENLYSLGKETEQIEFKKSTGETKEGVISMAAILNKHGSGQIYFGVKNDGTVVGQDVSDATLRTVSQTISNHLRPAVYPEIVEEKYGDSSVIHVNFEGTQQPYLAYNIPRIRVADEDLVMEQPVYEEMMRRCDNFSHSWERQLSKYKVSDIDMEIFRAYLKRARKAGRISFENDGAADVMTKLELSEGEWLLNAGAALFVDSGMNELQMAKFASDERLTFTDIRRYTGAIFGLSDKAVQYVIDAMDWRVEFDGSLERREIPEIPVDAVREAVINAFGHRLVESGQSVEVAIYRSFIEIYSPGKFPEGVSPEQFINEIRKPIRRNPLITRTLYYSKDMESFATGLKRIQDACDGVGCKVEYYGDDYGFTVRFYRHCGEGWKENISFMKDHSEKQAEKTSGKNERKKQAEKTSGKNKRKKQAEKTSENGQALKTIENKKMIVGFLEEEGSKKTSEIAKYIGLSPARTRVLLSELTEEGKIQPAGMGRSRKYGIIHV